MNSRSRRSSEDRHARSRAVQRIAENPLLRGSLNRIDKERHFPGRLENFVGPRVPSGDTVGRVYAQLDSSVLREVLRAVHLRIKRNKMLQNTSDWQFVAVDGHEFFRQPQTLLQPVPDAHLDSG